MTSSTTSHTSYSSKPTTIVSSYQCAYAHILGNLSLCVPWSSQYETTSSFGVFDDIHDLRHCEPCSYAWFVLCVTGGAGSMTSNHRSDSRFLISFAISLAHNPSSSCYIIYTLSHRRAFCDQIVTINVRLMKILAESWLRDGGLSLLDNDISFTS